MSHGRWCLGAGSANGTSGVGTVGSGGAMSSDDEMGGSKAGGD
jgi:hypothetical protein